MLGWLVCVAVVSAGPGEGPAATTGRRAWPIELRAITVEAELAAATARFGAANPTVVALQARLEALEDAKREAPTEEGSDQAMLAGELQLLDSRLVQEGAALKAKGLGASAPEVVAIAREREVLSRYLSQLPALELRAESGTPAVARAVVEEAIAKGRLVYLSNAGGTKTSEVAEAQQRASEAGKVIARSRVTPHDRDAIRGALTSAIHDRLDALHNPRNERDEGLIEAELDGLAIAHARLATRRFAGE